MTTLAHLMSERGIQIPSLSNQSENTWIEFSLSAPPTSKNFPATQPKNLRAHTHRTKFTTFLFRSTAVGLLRS